MVKTEIWKSAPKVSGNLKLNIAFYSTLLQIDNEEIISPFFPLSQEDTLLNFVIDPKIWQ